MNNYNDYDSFFQSSLTFDQRIKSRRNTRTIEPPTKLDELRIEENEIVNPRQHALQNFKAITRMMTGTFLEKKKQEAKLSNRGGKKTVELRFREADQVTGRMTNILK